ncbi:MAG TPA: hypothetical protein VJT49_15640 [Amycolatopsis sp.]|uniref:hypothetical protein n=1 Tax=Amycolatopsis sp. TaxID=37632 RepID=UPI002B4A4CEC|nr:hypothetical protein [Amycolatopsis sp.]HKS46511.1 hypothetical protein [Amycolatopsis sp.]
MTATTAERRVREFTTLARTTPGILGGFAVALVAVALLAGAFSGLSVQSRAQALDDLATRSGPLSVAAQEIYRSLSDADATATGALLSGGLEPAETRKRYEDDIAQATTALAIAVAAEEPADITPGSALATLSQQLPQYAGVVETARANNRQGLPVGGSYQGEATHLLRATLLPAAQELYRAEAGRVDTDQDRAGAFPVVELLLGLLVLGALVAAQVVLRRRTNRVFNLGLLAATAAGLVWLVWTLTAGFVVMADVGDSRTQGSAQVDVLAQARISTLAARADETLTLVNPGNGKSYQDDYVTVSRKLGTLLATAGSLATSQDVQAKIDAAKADSTAWANAHDALRKADDGGDHGKAVALALGDAGATFDRVDADLQGAIEQTRQAFSANVSAAEGALAGTVVGVSVLAVLVAVGSVAGIWRRLKEYR